MKKYLTSLIISFLFIGCNSETPSEKSKENQNNKEAEDVFDIANYKKKLETNNKAVIPLDVLVALERENATTFRGYFDGKWIWVSGEVVTIKRIKDYKIGNTVNLGCSNNLACLMMVSLNGNRRDTIKSSRIGQEGYDILVGGLNPQLPNVGSTDISNLHRGDIITVFGKCYFPDYGLLFLNDAVISEGNDENLLLIMQQRKDSVQKWHSEFLKK